jgi:hypothetical protein
MNVNELRLRQDAPRNRDFWVSYLEYGILLVRFMKQR